MNVTNINGFTFEGNLKVLNDPIRVKDATPQLQDKEISVKLDISKEGTAAGTIMCRNPWKNFIK